MKAWETSKAPVPTEFPHLFSLFSFLKSEIIRDFNASTETKRSFISQVPEKHPEVQIPVVLLND